MTSFPRIVTLSALLFGFSLSAFGQGFSPEVAVKRMSVAEGFQLELVAAEPLVRQPVAIDFDDRGRLWVLQYLQYPNPAGLKRVSVDRYSRTKYDRVPEPPPDGPVGADRLTILTDTNGDGRVDQAKDFIEGLNIATGFAFGYGGVFVLQTPYLLFYPDRDRDDIPDSDPEVLLKGFGMEDTSSLANSLLWGPDGWLYGAQGTNITANIRGIEFEQGIWRYHPVSREFELFAEGGANMWGLDFDRQGRLLAGTNYGGYLMLHIVQGAYYQKSFAKHGELHNPFAFGYFGHVPHQNFQGGHVTVGGFLYQSETFPANYRDKYIAVDTLAHAVRWHHVTPEKSTVTTANGGVLLQANDTWFAPSDSTVGPDGAVYIADWYDQRTAHPDPDANWDRSNGRIYRLQAASTKPGEHLDLHRFSNQQLVEQLQSRDEWKVRRARRLLAERKATEVADLLRRQIHAATDDHQVLQLLWTLAAIDAFSAERDQHLLTHRAADVRGWTIRLLGETRSLSRETAQQLINVAETDSSPSVISQLASTAQRLPTDASLKIAHAIASREEFENDPYIPLLVWWAVEKQVASGCEQVLEHFATPEAWQSPISRNVIVGRLMRRLAADGDDALLAACTKLLISAPDKETFRQFLEELDAGLKLRHRKRPAGLPLGSNFAKIAVQQVAPQTNFQRFAAVPKSLAPLLDELWDQNTTDSLELGLATRLGSERAYARTVELAASESTPENVRLSMLEILRELGDQDDCVPLGLQLVNVDQSEPLHTAALGLLSKFADKRITTQLVQQYQKMSPNIRAATRDVLFGRIDSALSFLQQIGNEGVPAAEVTADELRRLALHESPQIDALVRRHWGAIRAGTPEEKLAEIRRINNDLRAGPGNLAAGKELFAKHCATCHKLFGEGKEVGPDLTKANRHDREFLLSSIVDPSTQIRKEFLNYVVATKSGRLVTGLLVKENSAGVTILTAKNERISITTDKIEEMKVSAASLMPENLLKPLTPQQIRDLFLYLEHPAN